MKLLEIGKIVRPHGILGAVKVISFVEDNFNVFHKIFIGRKMVKAEITSCKNLNNDAFSIKIDVIKDVDTAEKFRNESIYINREEYEQFKDKVYLSDLINKQVVNENGEEIGLVADFDDYGASVILTIRCGATSYQIPFVDEIIKFNFDKDCFEIEQQKFEDFKVWK